MHADRKTEAGEMCMDGYTRGPFDLNHHFLLVQSDECAYGRVVFPYGITRESENGHEARASVNLPVSVGVTQMV